MRQAKRWRAGTRCLHLPTRRPPTRATSVSLPAWSGVTFATRARPAIPAAIGPSFDFAFTGAVPGLAGAGGAVTAGSVPSSAAGTSGGEAAGLAGGAGVIVTVRWSWAPDVLRAAIVTLAPPGTLAGAV